MQLLPVYQPGRCCEFHSLSYMAENNFEKKIFLNSAICELTFYLNCITFHFLLYMVTPSSLDQLSPCGEFNSASS